MRDKKNRARNAAERLLAEYITVSAEQAKALPDVKTWFELRDEAIRSNSRSPKPLGTFHDCLDRPNLPCPACEHDLALERKRHPKPIG
jgi:hypothetical protein